MAGRRQHHERWDCQQAPSRDRDIQLFRGGFDPAGKTTAEAYLNGFFHAIESDAAFYAPVVARPNTGVYVDAAKTRAACGAADTLPVGTPVSAPLQSDGPMGAGRNTRRALEMGAAGEVRRDSHRPVWIDESAIDTNFPPQ